MKKLITLYFLLTTLLLNAQVFVSTLAGNGTAGYLDTNGVNAQFSSPKGLCYDALGNVYVAEWGGGGRIRKIDPIGNVTTVASGMNNPNDVAVDPTGQHLYVVEWSGQRITHVDPNLGTVTVIAGNGMAGYIDGLPNSARFNLPSGITVGPNGDLFITEFSNHTVRRISMVNPTTAGNVSTLAGNGTSGCTNGVGSTALFQNPTGLCFNIAGDTIYVADWGNHVIRSINVSTGSVSLVAGICGVSGNVNGSTVVATFLRPHGIFSDAANNIYIAQEGNATGGHFIRRIDASTGNVSNFAGTGSPNFADGPALTSMFRSPFRVTGSCLGEIYIADTDNHRIRLITDQNIEPTFTGLDSSYCQNDPSVLLLPSPAGGIFSGSGINGNMFDPSQVQVGVTTYITYSYTDSYGCLHSITDSTLVNACCDTVSVLCSNNYTLGNNLVFNGDFEQGNLGFNSSYTYVPSSSWLNASEYDIVTNPQNTHNLFASCTDHTSGIGQMMVVNGSSTPNTNVWCQTININSNQIYEFGTWITSVDPQSPAILDFSINGVTIGTFSPSANTCNWQQFYTSWCSDTNTTATICIVNQNTQPIGNDFALDDIYFSERNFFNCDSNVTQNFYVNDYWGVDSTSLILHNNLCNPISNLNIYFDSPWFSGNIPNSINGNDSASIQIYFNANDSCIPFTINSFAVITASCPTFVSDTIWLIGNYTPPVFTAEINENDTTLCSSDSIILSSTQGDTFLWSSNPIGIVNSTDSSITVFASQSMVVYCAISDGCNTVIDSINIQVIPPAMGFVNVGICQGDSILLGGNYQTTSGNYNDTITGGSSSGCDSIVTTVLTVTPAINFIQTFVECEGFAISVGANVYSTTGIFNDTLLNTNGCDSIVTTDLTIILIPDFTISITDDNCEKQIGSITLTPDNPGVYTYIWTPNVSNTNSATNLPAGIYQIEVFNGNCTWDTTITLINNGMDPLTDFNYEVTDSTCFLGGFTTNMSVDASTFNWFIDGEFYSNTSFISFQFDDELSHTILLEAISVEGCKSSKEIILEFDYFDTPVFIPNVFTPNEDGMNDNWYVLGECVEEFECLIYNRWGNLLYTMMDIADKWDGTHNGKKVPQGVYVYTLTLKKSNGLKDTRRGHITIL